MYTSVEASVEAPIEAPVEAPVEAPIEVLVNNDIINIKLVEQESKLDELYEFDLKIYNKLKNQKEKIENFEIPEVFILKYNIYKKLEESNELSKTAFKIEWKKINLIIYYN